MSFAVHSGLRDASGRQVISLPLDVRKALLQADTALRAHGMQFELLCVQCHGMGGGPNGATVRTEHGKADGSVDALVCNCTRRNFLAL